LINERFIGEIHQVSACASLASSRLAVMSSRARKKYWGMQAREAKCLSHSPFLPEEVVLLEVPVTLESAVNVVAVLLALLALW